jgi:hypothetical protein
MVSKQSRSSSFLEIKKIADCRLKGKIKIKNKYFCFDFDKRTICDKEAP